MQNVAMSATGGLAGQVVTNNLIAGEISHSHATGSVTVVLARSSETTSDIGGLAGAVAGSVTDSYATGDVSVRFADDAVILPGGALSYYNIHNVGGLVGTYGAVTKTTGTLSNSFHTGKVEGALRLGGLVGQVSGGADATVIIKNVYQIGDVTALYGPKTTGITDIHVGGLIGVVANSKANFAISDVFAIADVTAKESGGYVGGLFGELDYPTLRVGTPDSPDYYYGPDPTYSRTLRNAYHVGNVIVAAPGEDTPLSYNGAGGLAGAARAYEITDAWHEGDVYGYSHVGGAFGSLIYSTAKNIWVDGSVTNDDQANYAGAGAYAGLSNGSTSSDVFYNGELNSTGISKIENVTGQENAAALTGEQVADGRYYANGTIEQVLADRAQAAADAAAQAAADAAAQAAADAAAQAAADAAAQAAADAAAQATAKAAITAGGEAAQALADPEPKAFTGSTFVSSADPVSPLANLLDESIAIQERRFNLDVEEVGVDGRYFQLNSEQEDKE
jgi:hypothetical protein